MFLQDATKNKASNHSEDLEIQEKSNENSQKATKSLVGMIGAKKIAKKLVSNKKNEELENSLIKTAEKDETDEISFEESLRYFEKILRKGKSEFIHLEKGFNNYAIFTPPNYVL